MRLTKRFGILVAARRKECDLTQQQLADAMEMSPDMISRIETGGSGARFPTIEKLAAALRVDPAAFFVATAMPESERRTALLDLTAKLARLSDDDLAWISQLLDAALLDKPGRVRVPKSETNIVQP